MLVHEGYRYVSNRESSKHIFWRCSRYVKYHCRATVVTSKNAHAPSIRISGPEHTHDPEMHKDMQYISIKEEYEKKTAEQSKIWIFTTWCTGINCGFIQICKG
uniref:Uncharacterized protein n=1 Tax=Phlebotomus papatasi TaxID=29031 RepID=A0A1B0GN81_PHLPP